MPTSTAPAAPKLTPMMRQYLETKERYPDAILLFRLGDFFEMFFEDAEIASRVLEITLTARPQGESSMPMCGVPHHAARSYISRLVEAGHKVALCDQVEDAAAARGIVRREVTQVITPGMVLDPEALPAKVNNYLCAISLPAEGDGPIGLAAIDVSTGEFRVTEIGSPAALLEEITRIGPREVVLPESLKGDGRSRELLARVPGQVATYLAIDLFDGENARSLLERQLRVASLAGFGIEGMSRGVEAAGAALAYAHQTQGQNLDHIHRIVPYVASEYMVLDEATRSNLELTRTLMEGKKRGSLLGLLDQTCTAMGGRLLVRWISYPLRNRSSIERRLGAVEALVEDPLLRHDLREQLKGIYDLERLNSRIAVGQAGPRDLAALRDSLARLPELKKLLAQGRADLWTRLAETLDDCPEIYRELATTLVDEPPVTLQEGGVVRTGVSPELDELVDLTRSGKDLIARVEVRERERTGIASLKVKYNKVFGYYLEVTNANRHLVPEDYIRKQTLANAERFVTPELKEYEEKVLTAEERRLSLERELFAALRERIAADAPRIAETARRVAGLDVLAGFAEIASQRDYVRPEVADDDLLEIQEGRHPVVEQLAAQLGERFVPNDVRLDSDGEQLIIITGPNMAGKSTVMRQVALITLMAQVGCFVPARRAHVGLVDRIFTRVGASDNLSRGRSTFMVEMTETANILHNATRKSLVILDEIGRGTSTFDGLSIAWAVAEYLHDRIGARTLFATHYHELTDLSAEKERVCNMNIAVKEWNDEIIFLRKLVAGATNRSYGIQVGRLAGLPEPVVARAREILANLEAGERDAEDRPVFARHHEPQGASNPAQLALFGSGRPSPVEEAIARVEIDTLTPLEALNLLYRLKQQSEKSKS